MLAKIYTSHVSGVNAFPVEVEVRAGLGAEGFSVIGLVDSAVREARDRVRTALEQVGFLLPKSVLVNLAPAEQKKEGSSFDLAIAIGILCACREVPDELTQCVTVYGELALDGRVKGVRGILAHCIHARERNFSGVIVPSENAQEAKLIGKLRVIDISHLKDAVLLMRTGELPEQTISAAHITGTGAPRPRKSLQEVAGQESAKRALRIAAAGGHNVLMIGPPGCGKSMLAERFTDLLPNLEEQEKLETVRVHSVAGLPIHDLLQGFRPFRNPHHVISEAGLIGGGPMPKPGEVSLAHHGVLFLDEFPEFPRSALEALRIPMETGKVSVTRVRASVVFPAEFELIAAMNPCPCGRLGAKGLICQCPKTAVVNYLKKLSQPILDRIDLHVELDAVPVNELHSLHGSPEQQFAADERIQTARAAQLERGGLNARAEAKNIFAHVLLSEKGKTLIERWVQARGVSARSYIKVLKVARTIADFENTGEVKEQHIAEAISYRGLERLERFLSGPQRSAGAS